MSDTKSKDTCPVNTEKSDSDSCCSVPVKNLSEDSCCGSSTEEIKREVEKVDLRPFLPAAVSLILLVSGIILKFVMPELEGSLSLLILFLAAYFIVGWKTIWKAVKLIPTANIFNEFFLMTIATVGAFAIGEYSEGVAVMLFYEVGELFNGAAVKRAKRSIKALLDIRPDTVTLIKDHVALKADPKSVRIGENIQVVPGERLALDGTLTTEYASFNTSALTGESKPVTVKKGEKVLAGMISLDQVAEVRVESTYENSSLSKILSLVQDSLAKKAKTEKFITKLAKVYTPVVVFLALGITFLPYFFASDYEFTDWLYRGLIFLVISCPCALVMSIPLGYFGGIGASSRNGVLFKGSSYLDMMTSIDTIVMDKTGTLTKGVFRVQQVVVQGIDDKEFIRISAALESKSSHPVAKAVAEFNKESFQGLPVSEVTEIAGYGLKGKVDGYEVVAGNTTLLTKFGIGYDRSIDDIAESLVVVAIDGVYKGYIVIADEIKEDAREAVEKLHNMGKTVIMLSGDKDTVVQSVAKAIGIDKAYGGLLPQDKVSRVEDLKKEGRRIAFVGDGVNDAPVIALADVGIAMGGLGSDATIETADVVIQTDQPSKIATAIDVSKATRRVVWQNIILALGVKSIVLVLGAWGLASLWEAVFADVGVALLAILNAVRIQKMKF